MDHTVIDKFKGLDTRVREATQEYYHSRPLATYAVQESDSSKTVSIDLRGMLLTSAVTANNVLLTGTTGAGKTQ